VEPENTNGLARKATQWKVWSLAVNCAVPFLAAAPECKAPVPPAIGRFQVVAVELRVRRLQSMEGRGGKRPSIPVVRVPITGYYYYVLLVVPALSQPRSPLGTVGSEDPLRVRGSGVSADPGSTRTYLNQKRRHINAGPRVERTGLPSLI
jgi:hypothetical protein